MKFQTQEGVIYEITHNTFKKGYSVISKEEMLEIINTLTDDNIDFKEKQNFMTEYNIEIGRSVDNTHPVFYIRGLIYSYDDLKLIKALLSISSESYYVFDIKRMYTVVISRTKTIFFGIGNLNSLIFDTDDLVSTIKNISDSDVIFCSSQDEINYETSPKHMSKACLDLSKKDREYILQVNEKLAKRI